MSNASLCESSSSLLSSKQRLVFSPTPKYLTSTPVASVPAQLRAMSNLSHSNLVNANRKRKSSAPVFSNRQLQNSQIKLTPNQRGGFVNLLAAKNGQVHAYAASKSLNFASPIGRDQSAPVIKKAPILRKAGARTRAPSLGATPAGHVHFLLPNHHDSGLGISPALPKENKQ